MRSSTQNSGYLTPLSISLVIVAIVGVLYLHPVTTSLSSTSQAFTLIASLIAAVASIWNSFSVYQNSVRLEELKQRLSVKFPALQETTDAALQYYYTLSELELGKFDPDQVKQSEEAMKKVTGRIYFLNKDYQEAWYRYWQKARFISESVDDQHLDKAKIDWKSNWGRDLSLLLEKLEMNREIM